MRSSGRFLGKLAVYLLVILLVSVTGAWSRPTTPAEVRNVVANWLALDAQPLDAAMSPQVKKVQSFNGPDGTPAYYVVYLNPTGLVILPADDLVEPIVGFLPAASSYNPSQKNPLGALVSKDIPGRVLQAREVEASSLEMGQPLAADNPAAAAQRKWAWLANPIIGPDALEFGVTSISDVRVAPLVKSKWSQTTVSNNACYNYYTPPYAAGTAQNYPSGCVATALAQLLRYFQYPTVGVGTASFTIYVNGNPEPENLRGGNGSGGAYSWASMVTVPTSPTAAQRQAIGNLTHDAGVAVNMSYYSDGSGAYTSDTANALINTFKYSNAKTGHNSGYTNLAAANRNRMVNPNLHAKFPVLFGIAKIVGGAYSNGHAIVCDGYGYQTSTMYHHLNMGWAGYDDAWYYLPAISPSGYTANSVHTVVYNVYKTGTGEIIAGRVTAGGVPVSGATVTATRTGTTYKRTVTTDAKGIYALSKVPSAASYSVKVTKAGYTFPTKSTKTTTSVDGTITTGNVMALDFPGTAN